MPIIRPVPRTLPLCIALLSFPCSPGARAGRDAVCDAQELAPVVAPRGTVAGVADSAPRTAPRSDSAGAPAADTALRLDLDVPAFRLDVYENGVRTRSYRVAVGMPKYRTPRGAFTVTDVVWHPWWIPPDREWARKEHPTPPGPENPMGKVKLRFGSMYYLHGTPEPRSIGHAASHGCVRMANEDAVALARIVQRYTAPAAARDSEEHYLADSTITRNVALVRPVPITVRYDVAEVRDDSLLLYPDVYGLARDVGEAARAVLASAAGDARRIDDARLRAAVALARKRRVSLPLDSLLEGGRLGR
ncbi:MAG TPA: L,D-transpeptidase [Gemmatimonadaceae bacterium]|nr:L,D-transpeptidase [Gemmatimonadaceae bacterium]